MTPTATDPLQQVLARLPGHKGNGDGSKFTAFCPRHESPPDGHSPSLSITRGDDGRVLVNCLGGCAPEDVVKALGLKMRDLFADAPPKTKSQRRTPAKKPPTVYPTLDAAIQAQARIIGGKVAWQRRYPGPHKFHVVRYDLPTTDAETGKPDKTCRPFHETNKGFVCADPPGSLTLYGSDDLPADGPIIVTEGELMADAARSIDMPAVTSAHGCKSAHLSDWTRLAGREIIILADNDAGGLQYAQDVAAILTAIGCKVRIVLLPGLPLKGDLVDWLSADGPMNGKTKEECREAILALADKTPGTGTKQARDKSRKAAPAGDTLRNELEILIGIDESRVVSETIAALTYDKEIYQRSGVLVRIRRDATIEDGVIRPAGSPTIQVLPPANLRERMTRVARFTKINAKGNEVPSHPAAWLVSAVDARGDWPGIRPLTAISDAPVLRPDGTIWQQSGYDSATGVLFESNQTFPPVPEHPTIDDARRALDELLEVVCDFPLQAPEHRAVWLAGLLTPPARFAFTGPAPLVLADANVAGAGKGLLIHTIGRINTGRDVAVSTYAHDGDELRKRITSIALAGDRLVLLDNIEGAFGNATLDRLLTATYWKDRILGRNEEVTLPLTATWYATGNNVAIAADTARRVIHIRLDTMNEHPDQRADFRHPSLLEWVTENRPRLLTAALTILAAYFEAGCPSQGLTPYGSFEGWSNLVRQAVVWVGQPDPCKTRVQLMESADVTAGILSQLIEAWRAYVGNKGCKVSELVNQLYPADRHQVPGDPASIEMRAALEALTGASATKPPTAKQVAGRLRFFRRRPIDGHFLDIDESEGRAQGRTWILRKVTP